MNLGERFVYLTAWLAVACYFAALLAPRTSRRRRTLWTLGWLAFVLHVVAAFHFVHHWSHAEAAASTSRRALEVTGRPATGGIYYNYAFLFVWTLDVAWQWTAPTSYARRPRPIAWLVHGFLAFIVFNAAVVFAHGPLRWLSLAAFVVSAAVQVRRGAR
jgi:hypothetical protein